MSLKIKYSEVDSWDFSPKLVGGCQFNVSGNKIIGIKVLKKIYTKKKVPSLVKMRSSRGVFIEKTFFKSCCNKKHRKSQNGMTLFPKTFISRIFSIKLFKCQNVGLCFQKLFFRKLFGGYLKRG